MGGAEKRGRAAEIVSADVRTEREEVIDTAAA
jgi:hypothetical protein